MLLTTSLLPSADLLIYWKNTIMEQKSDAKEKQIIHKKTLNQRELFNNDSKNTKRTQKCQKRQQRDKKHMIVKHKATTQTQKD